MDAQRRSSARDQTAEHRRHFTALPTWELMEPRIAWLPITTNSPWPVTFTAAPIMWSNSCACTSAQLQRSPPLWLAEHPGKRRVLAQVVADLAFAFESPAYLGDRTVKQLLPLLGVPGVDTSLLAPTEQCVTRLLDHRTPQTHREHTMVGQAAITRTVVPLLGLSRQWREPDLLGRLVLTIHGRLELSA
jgi:hypothetical protein